MAELFGRLWCSRMGFRVSAGPASGFESEGSNLKPQNLYLQPYTSKAPESLYSSQALRATEEIPDAQPAA